ncbi:O-antigen ligase family protein [Winogradskyella poriferorum]|uniref:O-antigen ligase family protein n=1 Tax=Winogradskyella poriferorum TaxID=307627 RepID=UPI003D6474FE
MVTLFISDTYAQLLAYTNLLFNLAGAGLMLQIIGTTSKTARLWFIFYTLYFIFSLSAGIINHNPGNLMVGLIPVFYTIGFYQYFKLKEHINIFENILLISLTLVCIINIYWYTINFDIVHASIPIFKVDRAQGVYGDANNMALVSLLGFIFAYKMFPFQTFRQKIMKIILLIIFSYSLFITFSNTGFMVLIISLVILNINFFTGVRLLLLGIMLPMFYVILLNLNNLTANLNLVGQQRDKINNIVNILSFNFDKVDASGRDELASNLYDKISQKPFFGNGLDFAASQRGHNTILGVWADAGVFVFIFFIFLLGVYYFRALKSPMNTKLFIIPMLISLTIFMLSLQTIINQPYLIAIFLYIAYKIDLYSLNSSDTVE